MPKRAVAAIRNCVVQSRLLSRRLRPAPLWQEGEPCRLSLERLPRLLGREISQAHTCARCSGGAGGTRKPPVSRRFGVFPVEVPPKVPPFISSDLFRTPDRLGLDNVPCGRCQKTYQCKIVSNQQRWDKLFKNSSNFRDRKRGNDSLRGGHTIYESMAYKKVGHSTLPYVSIAYFRHCPTSQGSPPPCTIDLR